MRKIEIEKITPKSVRAADTATLSRWHLELHRQYEAAKGFGAPVEEIVHAHGWVVAEMRRRGMEHVKRPGLDTETLPRPVNKNEIVLVPDYVTIVGSAVFDLENAKDIDVMVREDPDVPTYYKESLWLRLRQLFDPDKTGKKLHVLYNPQGPHDSRYISVYDLVLKPSFEERLLVKAAGLRLTLMGVGAANSPRYKPAGLLIEYHGARVMIDGSKKNAPAGSLDAWLTTDEHGELAPELREFVAAEKGLKLFAGNYHRGGPEGGLTILAHEVEHTSHPAFGYEIRAAGKKVVWAPEFFKFPSWAKDADLMFAEAAGWNRPILFAGGVGGHMAALDVAREAKKAGIKKLVFAHIGRPSIRAREAGLNPPFGEWGSDGDVYVLRRSALTRAIRQLMKVVVKPLSMYRAQKPSMLFYTDFVSVKEMWDNWANKVVEKRGYVLVSPKVDGLRAILHSDGAGNIRVWSEDQKEDYADKTPDLSDALKRSKESLIIEGELLAKKDGEWLSRADIVSALAGNVPGADFYVMLYDLLYWDGQGVSQLPFRERLGTLKKIADKLGSHFVVLPQVEARSEAELKRVSRALLRYNAPVEGVVARDPEMPYVFGSTNLYAKFKRYLELKVQVVGVDRVKNGYVYEAALKDDDGKLVTIGKTFVTEEKLADVGDTLNVGVEELQLKRDGTLAWHKPRPLGVDRSRGPYTVAQAISMARRFGRLTESVQRFVPGSNAVKPVGPKTARLAIVGDGPGPTERKEGKPLVGPAGQFLRELLAELGVDPEDVYWANIYDGDEGKPTAAKTKLLGKRALARLGKLPELRAVLALGLIAAQGLTGESITTVDQARDESYTTPDGVSIIVTYHAAAIMRSGQRKSKLYPAFRDDVRQAVELAYGTRKAREEDEDVEDLPTRGEVALKNWEENWFDMVPRSGGGRFIVQHHWRGLSEEEAMNATDEELMRSPHSVHTDFRLESDDALWGITLFTGDKKKNIEAGGDQFLGMKPGGDQLQGTIKLAQPKEWLRIGVGKPFIARPNEVGATSAKYAKFFAIDSGTYRLGVVREHAIELFLNGKKLKGRYQFVFAKEKDGRRFWVMRKPEDQTPQADRGPAELRAVLRDVMEKNQRGLVWSNGRDKPLFIPREKFKLVLSELEKDAGVGYEVVKAVNEKRYTFGVLYKATNDPNNPELDAHREWVTADELQQAQWEYVRSGNRDIQFQHGLLGPKKLGEWVDIVAWPKEETVELIVPGEKPRKTVIPANSIWMGVVWNEEGWQLVKSGQIRGLSMGGWARRRR